jgi:acyl carrier protein
MAVAQATQEKVAARIREALVEFGADPAALRAEATLEELEIDSLDLFELGQILNQEFGIEVDPDDFDNVVTLGDAEKVLLEYAKK